MTSQKLHKRLLAYKSCEPLKNVINNLKNINIIALEENIKSKQ